MKPSNGVADVTFKFFWTTDSYCTRIFFFKSSWENESDGKYYFGLVNVKGNSAQRDHFFILSCFNPLSPLITMK